jgi:uncharacterized protein YgiM (DUF1202 family)
MNSILNDRLSRIVLYCLICVNISGFLIADDTVGGPSSVEGVVTANILNVRANPGVKYEVVCQLRSGDKVRIIQVRGDWLGIEAPPETEAWIALSHLDHDRVIDHKVSVYSGPGSIFSSYATLNRNETVTILRTIEDKWVKIRRPSHAIVWVHKSYIAADPDSKLEIDGQVLSLTGLSNQEEDSNAPRENEQGSPAAVLTSESTMPKGVKIKQLSIKPISYSITFIGNPRTIEQIGTVISLGRDYAPFKYALASLTNASYYPLAYLRSGSENLDDWLWKEVKIQGSRRWIRGCTRPLIQVAAVTPIEKFDN